MLTAYKGLPEQQENEAGKRGIPFLIPGGHPNSPTDGHLKLPHLN